MVEVAHTVPRVEGIGKDDIPAEILASAQPVILSGLVASWPLVQRAQSSDTAAMDYMKSFYNGRSTIVCKLPPEAQGRLFYDATCTRLEYASYIGRIDEVLDLISGGLADPNAPDFYIASNIVDTHFPKMRQDNDLTVPRALVGDFADPTTVSIWIGTATTASCHYDALDNIACCVAGRRRFTLFPPDQVENLYPGPLDPTPGGQAISLVNFNAPNFDRFPRFADALANGYVAELEPGDALYVPSMWWHHVEALAPFNLLVNYWWSDAPRFLTSGMNALYAAMLGIRDKPEHEREAWKHLFDYYIFGGSEAAASHIPDAARGFLQQLDDLSARKLRAALLNKLNR